MNMKINHGVPKMKVNTITIGKSILKNWVNLAVHVFVMEHNHPVKIPHWSKAFEQK